MSVEILVAIIGAVGPVIGFFAREIYNFLKKKILWRKNYVKELKNLQYLLNRSRSIFFENQRFKRVTLNKMIFKNHPDDIPKEFKTETDLYYEIYPKLTREEKEIHALLRGTTKNLMFPVNSDIQKWLKENWPKLKKLDNKLKTELSNCTISLQKHLDSWFNIYHSIFSKDERYALCFAADEKGLGIGFPRGIDEILDKLIVSIEK